jgi:hypothetical protein
MFGREPAAPTDLADLNAFATAYNRYVESLRDGHLDLRQWARAWAAWQRITKQ